MDFRNIVIVGASHAGVSVATKLRELEYHGQICLISAEDVLPYERPPLSKGYFLGKVAPDQMLLRSADYYRERDIELRLSTRVEAIDPQTRSLSAGGVTMCYDKLVLTTGAQARHLPPVLSRGLDGVLYIRSRADADRMIALAGSTRSVLVIGGGFIGLEAAAAFRQRGAEVCLIEAQPRILGRVAAQETSAYFRRLHEGYGVRMLEGLGVSELVGDERVHGAVLSNGEELEADLVIAGIGILPEIGLAQAAGLAIDNGIAVDRRGRTSAPCVWAAGDCASFPFGGARVRLESVQNAVDQGAMVASDIAGLGADYAPVPWFWSDQYDVKLQIAGLNTGYDRVVVRDGGKGLRSHWYFAGDRLLSVDAMNDAQSFMMARRLIKQGRNPLAADIADPGFDLMCMLKR